MFFLKIVHLGIAHLTVIFYIHLKATHYCVRLACNDEAPNAYKVRDGKVMCWIKSNRIQLS